MTHAATRRWKHRPEGSNWGDFGPDDQHGRVNLITPEKVRQGIAEVREGRTFCLSLPLDFPGRRLLNPRRFPPRLFSTRRGGLANFNFPLGIEDPRLVDVVCDDAALICLQYSTQWDSLCHVGARFDADGDGVAELVYYNGWRADEHIVSPTDTGDPNEFTRFAGSEARRLGIQNMAEACIQGRGVMIDLEKHCGRTRELVGHDRLMQIIRDDDVTVEPGDIVCLHSGFSQVVLEMARQPDLEALDNSCAVLDGRDQKLLGWIRDSGLAILVGDAYGIEDTAPTLPVGNEPLAMLPLHHHCIFKLGIHLGELFYLHELARWLRANGRSRFLFTGPPLRLPGAVGSPATPVATV